MNKGIILLAEGRSGTNWLGSLLKTTGVLGKPGEWVDANQLGVSPEKISGPDYIARIIDAASTDNGFFAVKMFPSHLRWFQQQYGFDLLSTLRREYDIKFVTLRREDRVAQAVSFAKASQHNAWSSEMEGNTAPVYDFHQIQRAFFLVGHSYRLWNDYVMLRQIEAAAFTYEELLPTGAEFVRLVADHAGIDNLRVPQSKMKIQRNPTSEEWTARFLQEVKEAEFPLVAWPPRLHGRSLSNLFRFLKHQQMN